MHRSHPLPPRRLASLLLIASLPLLAGEHEAHVHGVLELDVVQERQTLQIELRSPAMNLVGFEHAPADAADRAAVARAIRTLEDAAALFVPDAAAACRLVEAKVATDLHETHDDAAHDQHDAQHGHEHGHGGTTEAANEHSDVHAAYRYECAHPDDLRGIDVRLIAAFPATQEIHVRTITDAAQNAVELTPGRTRIPLTGTGR